jgi:hypothetical protein
VNFSGGPVKYTVTAADGITKKDYWVTVQSEPPPLSSEKNITALSINGVTGNINGTAITVTLPYGTNVSSLTPVVTHTGASYSPTTAQNFSSQRTYTVTAADGSQKSYTVTVVVNPAPPSSAKAITSFSLEFIPQYTEPHEPFIGVINETYHAINFYIDSLYMYHAFIPTIEHTGASISDSGSVTQGNFYLPQGYTVYAEDGSSQLYTVTVNWLGHDDYDEIAEGNFKAYHADNNIPVAGVVISEEDDRIEIFKNHWEGEILYAEVTLPSNCTISPDPATPRDYSEGVEFVVRNTVYGGVRIYRVELITVMP